MKYEVSFIDASVHFGAIVSGLKSADIADPEVRQSLYDLWVDRGVIVFRDVEGGGDVQMPLSRIFGSPEVHPLRDPNRKDSAPELADIWFRPDDGDIVQLDGKRLGGYLPWHFDLVYLPKINRGGILRAVTKPKHGGATGFLDKAAIYDSLPAQMKAQVEGREAIYLYDPYMEHQRYGKSPGFVQERVATRSIASFKRLNLPPVAHPLVVVQEGTGRKLLNFSPWYSTGIAGMAQDQADPLLEELAIYCTDVRGAYFHQWDYEGEMVLWDNWRMLHCATGVPADEARHMQRTTIHGDYGVGRVLERDLVSA